MKAFVTNFKLFNKMQHWSLLGHFREYRTSKTVQGLRSWITQIWKWFRCLGCFYRIKTFGLPSSLSNLILSCAYFHSTRNSVVVFLYHCRTNTFKHSFFSWTVLDQKELDCILRKSSYNAFRKYFLKLRQSSPNLAHDIHNRRELYFITRIRLRLSHLNEYTLNENLET